MTPIATAAAQQPSPNQPKLARPNATPNASRNRHTTATTMRITMMRCSTFHRLSQLILRRRGTKKPPLSGWLGGARTRSSQVHLAFARLMSYRCSTRSRGTMVRSRTSRPTVYEVTRLYAPLPLMTGYESENKPPNGQKKDSNLRLRVFTPALYH